VIDGIGGRQRVDVNSRFRQLLTHAGKRAGTIRKENGELGGRFNRELGMCVHAGLKLTTATASDN
jgi:hypothetical protein